MPLLGLDVGGSHCRTAWLPDTTAASQSFPGVQPAVVGAAKAVDHLANVLQSVVATAVPPEQVVVAMAGAGDRTLAAAIVDGLRTRGIAYPLAVVGDVLAAAAGALGSEKHVLLWAGTGSFAVARRVDGGLVRVGGRGYLLGDGGSAYDLVRNAARAALRALDGLAAPTVLGERLSAAMGSPAVARLGATMQQLTPGEVARHLGVVLQAASAGDAVAQHVLREGIAELVQLAAAGAAKAGITLRGARVVLGGGIFTALPARYEEAGAALRLLGAAEVELCDPLGGARGAALLARALATHAEPLASLAAGGAL